MTTQSEEEEPFNRLAGQISLFGESASQEDAYLTILGLAAGEISENELGAWFERNSEPK